MGAWGIGNFENDLGLDYLFEVEDNLNIDYLIGTIKSGLKEDYLDSDMASEALIAIELIAASKGNPSNDYEVEDNIRKFVEKDLKSQIKKEHLVLCEMMIDKVLDKENSELYELWRESDDYFADWFDAIQDLKIRLK